MKAKTLDFVEHIVTAAQGYERTGQYLFNHLPDEVAVVVRGSIFDPFYKDYDRRGLYAWLEDHLIFDENVIVAVFNGDQILWEGRA